MIVGVTVLPEYIQNEGVDSVLDRLAAAGVTHVATSPYVMEPADQATGSREPPVDAGAGGVRLLDRPLWGKRELFVRTAPSFMPNVKHYAGLAYQPATPNALTAVEGGKIAAFIKGAHARKLKVYLQVQAAIPPGYRVQFGGPKPEDTPRLPDGRVPPMRLDKNGSLASPRIVAYVQALTRDLLDQYPEIDGIRYDWPEYTPYMLDDLFLDFSEPARAAAQRLGYPFERMRVAASKLYQHLHGGLTNKSLEQDFGRYGMMRMLMHEPALVDWLRFKAALVEELFVKLRQVVPSRIEIAPGAFPPPFSLASGMDYGKVARHVSAIHVKLYTMHWPMMFRFYGDALLKANPKLDERLLVKALSALLELTDGQQGEMLANYNYPEPDQPHPAGVNVQTSKIKQAQAEAGNTPVIAFVHGYGPVNDFGKRLEVGWKASRHGIWINRYGYLSNEKIAVLGRLVKAQV